MCHIAPVVKWISQLTSDQLFWVRVLAGAQMASANTIVLALLPFVAAYQDSNRGAAEPAGGMEWSRGPRRVGVERVCSFASRAKQATHKIQSQLLQDN